MKLSKIPEYVTIAMVFVVGIIAVLVFFFDTIQSAWFPEEVDLMRFIAASMGTILVALGIERITIFARQESKFDGIKQLAMKSIQCVREVGYDKIMIEGTERSKSAKKEIRTVAVGTTHTAPISWSETIARRLAESKEAGNPIYFTSVTVIDPESDSRGFIAGMDDRTKIYRRNDVTDLVRHYILETRLLGFDIIIIDDSYLAIGIPREREVKDPNRAIIFYEMPDLVDDFKDWHKDVLMNLAGIKPYSDWRQERQTGSI